MNLVSKIRVFHAVTAGLGFTMPAQAEWLLFLGLHRILKFPTKRRPYQCRFNSGRHAVWLDAGEDYDVALEIFAKKMYLIPRLPSSGVIVDLGAHIGLASLWFATRYPEAKIYAFEAEPRNFSVLVRNTASLRNIVPIHAALSGEPGAYTKFYSHTSRSVSHSLQPREGSSEVTVPNLRFDDIFPLYGLTHIDLLKFDVEGAEYNILRDAKRLRDVSVAIGELHKDLIGIPEGQFMLLFTGFVVEFTSNSRRRAVLVARRI